jgi:hypothetical protein
MPCHSEGAGTGHTAQQSRRPKNPRGVSEILQSPELPQDDRNTPKLDMLYLRESLIDYGKTVIGRFRAKKKTGPPKRPDLEVSRGNATRSAASSWR